MSNMLVNGQIVARGNIVNIEDRGYQFGDGVFEEIGVCEGKAFMMNEHMERLNRSEREIQLSMHNTTDQLKSKLVELVAVNKLDDDIIYMQVSRGTASREHYFPDADVSPVTIAYTSEEERMTVTEEQGATAVLTEDIRWLRCDIKTLNLLPN